LAVSIVIGAAQSIGHDGIKGAGGGREMMLPRPGHRQRITARRLEPIGAELRVQPVLPDPSQRPAPGTPLGGAGFVPADDRSHKCGNHTTGGPQTAHSFPAVVQESRRENRPIGPGAEDLNHSMGDANRMATVRSGQPRPDGQLCWQQLAGHPVPIDRRGSARTQTSEESRGQMRRCRHEDESAGMFRTKPDLRLSFQYVVSELGPADLAGSIGAGIKPLECRFHIVEFDPQLHCLSSFIARHVS